MVNTPTISKKMLIASVLGIIIILTALYINTSKRSAVSQSANVTPILTPEQARLNIDIDNIPLNNPPSSDESKSSEAQTLTETDILTRNVLGPYLQQLQDGTYSVESKSKILQDATKYMLTIDFTPLTSNDIVISDVTNSAAVKIYKDALQGIMQPLFDIPEYELTTYARAVQDNSKEGFNTIATIATMYQEAGNRAKELPAPQDVSAVHLDIVNSLLKFSVILNELAKGYDDPAASLSGVANFTQVENDLGEAFDNLKTYFVLKKVYNTNI